MTGQGRYFVFKSGRVNNSVNNFTPVAFPDPENALVFNEHDKSDEDIVYNSGIKTYLPVGTLANDSETTRLARNNKKNGTNDVPRRQNAWIIYRRDKNSMPELSGLKPPIVSKIIGEMWSNEPQEVKDFYGALSRLAIKNHIKKYGSDYKYRPKFKKMKQRNKRSKKNNELESTSLLTPATSNNSSPITTSSSDFEEESSLTDAEHQIFLTPTTSNTSSPNLPDLIMNADFHTLITTNTSFSEYEEQSQNLSMNTNPDPTNTTFPLLSEIIPAILNDNLSVTSSPLEISLEELIKQLFSTPFEEQLIDYSPEFESEPSNDFGLVTELTDLPITSELENDSYGTSIDDYDWLLYSERMDFPYSSEYDNHQPSL